jgi:xanthine dehydrogenase molybdopterin binding subunit
MKTADLKHDSAIKHVTGQSVYVNDISANRLLVGRVVYSNEAHARISLLDTKAAAKLDGIVAILTHKDIPGNNQMGPVIHDELCLAIDEVTFIGQAIVLIAAETEEAAHRAEKLIRMEFEELNTVLDLHEAIAENCLIAPPRLIECGNVDETFKSAPHVISGELESGAQEHWYLETQSALAVPGEGKEMLIHASSQNPAETQAIVAEVLGIAKNEVDVEVRRMGGAFGGKETQGNHVAAWAALLANATHSPVGIHLFRDDDQKMTGKRHRFLSRYQVGFNDDGKILVYSVELNSDAGAATDLSRAILERAMLHAENAYFIPNARIIGNAYRTNLPSNTAFRGFGGPQGMAVIETAIDKIARFLKKDPAEIRKLNFYGIDQKNCTPYGETVVNNRLHLMYDQLLASSKYSERRKSILGFNQENEFTKRGISLTPVKFGISFTTAFLNQAGALVNIYNDGTIAVNHGGTEMGQGLHTKILGIAADEFGVSPGIIKINPTNTSKVPNTSATAASSGSDLNGMAVKNAIETLKSRLTEVAIAELKSKLKTEAIQVNQILFADNAVFATSHPDTKIPFSELVKQAYLNKSASVPPDFTKHPVSFSTANWARAIHFIIMHMEWQFQKWKWMC